MTNDSGAGGGLPVQGVPSAPLLQTRWGLAQIKKNNAMILTSGSTRFGRRRLGHTTVRRLLQTWAVAAACSGDLPAPKLGPTASPRGPSLLLCSNCGEKQWISCTRWKFNSRLLRLVDQNSSKSGAIYRGFWYGIIEKSETYPFYLLVSFKSQILRRNRKGDKFSLGWTQTWVKLRHDGRV
jgi:hypothetical protein